MGVIENKRINEKYTQIKHPSGLTILLCPMAGYSSSYALFGTKYGSIDTTFKTNEDADFITVPEGIAHFLEHKLFENEDCDVFSLYAKNGANPNAYTSFDKTAYLFSGTDKFKENLEILLDFVQKPYFTDETVQKEQGIIGQEIQMYRDDPGWRVFFNCLTCLYHNNPVRIDIAGTKESIAEIDAQLLYRCYNTFYNLNNMVLSIAGNIDPDVVMEACDRLLKPGKDIGLETKIPNEPEKVKSEENVQIMPVSMPLFNMAFKTKYREGINGVKDYIHCNMALDLIMGRTSPLYKEIFESGLINQSFSASCLTGRGFFAPMCSGESKDPREVYKKVKAAVKEAQIKGFDKERFEIIKKETYGQLLRGFNSVRTVAQSMMDSYFNGVTSYDYIETAANTTINDINNYIKTIDTGNSCISIVRSEA